MPQWTFLVGALVLSCEVDQHLVKAESLVGTSFLDTPLDKIGIVQFHLASWRKCCVRLGCFLLLYIINNNIISVASLLILAIYLVVS